MKKTKRIALTGIMGAGKSSVIRILQELHIPVLDCDEINRDLMQKHAPGYHQIIDAFGRVILNSEEEIDVKKMSDLIFTDVQKKQQLEAILHPLIKAEIMKQCDACEAEIIVVEVPLLFEVHWQSYFDEAWVVTCAKEVLIERLAKFRNIDEAEARRRLAHQMSQTEKCALADVVLHNDQDIDHLKQQIIQELNRLMQGGIGC